MSRERVVLIVVGACILSSGLSACLGPAAPRLASSPSHSYPPGCQPTTIEGLGLVCWKAKMPPPIDHAMLRLAVIPLSENGAPGLPQSSQEEIRAFAEMEAVLLKEATPRLEIVERNRINVAIHELEIQTSGQVRDDNFVGVGRMLGADHLLIYQVTADFDDRDAFPRLGGLIRALAVGKVIGVQTGALVFQQSISLMVSFSPPPLGKEWKVEQNKVRMMKEGIFKLFRSLHQALLPAPIGISWWREQDSNVSSPVKVNFVWEGSPAHLSGIQYGDLITAIDGMPVRGMGDRVLQDLEMIQRELVHITIQRKGQEQTLPVRPLRRNSIEKSSTPYKP